MPPPFSHYRNSKLAAAASYCHIEVFYFEKVLRNTAQPFSFFIQTAVIDSRENCNVEPMITIDLLYSVSAFFTTHKHLILIHCKPFWGLAISVKMWYNIFLEYFYLKGLTINANIS